MNSQLMMKWWWKQKTEKGVVRPLLWCHHGSYWAFLVGGRMRKSESWCRKSLQQLEHPADAQTRFWEDNSIGSNTVQRKPSWPHSFISVSHIGVNSSLMSSTPLLLSVASLRTALCIVEAAGPRQRSPAECRVLLWVLTSLHSSDFHCLEFVLSHRSFWSAACPLSGFWNTHIRTSTQWCNLHRNLNESSVLAGCQSQLQTQGNRTELKKFSSSELF